MHMFPLLSSVAGMKIANHVECIIVESIFVVMLIGHRQLLASHGHSGNVYSSQPDI